MYYVYIIYSESHKRFYIGQTQDFGVRISRHNNGIEKSTRPYAPWKKVCLIEKDTRSQAVQLEKKLKNLNTPDLIIFISKYGDSDMSWVAR